MLKSPRSRETAFIARRILRSVRNGEFNQLGAELSRLNSDGRLNPPTDGREQERQEVLQAVAERMRWQSPFRCTPGAAVCVHLLRHLAAG